MLDFSMRNLALLMCLALTLLPNVSNASDYTWSGEYVDGHPKYCAVGVIGTPNFVLWSNQQCAEERAKFARLQRAGFPPITGASSTAEATGRTSTGASSTAVAPGRTSRSTADNFLSKGTPIPVQAMSGYNSYAALAGEKLRYEVMEDVVVGGLVIAKRGDTAYGRAQEALRGGCTLSIIYCFSRQAASLRVSVDDVYNFCGDTIHVYFDRSEYRSVRTGFLHSNDNVVIAKGQAYLAVTDRPQRVCGETTSAPDSTPPETALQTSDH